MEELEKDEALERFEAGNGHLQDNRLDEAEEQYREALKANSEFAEAYNNLGLTLFYKSRFDEAIEEYRNALRIEPEFGMAHANLGLALLNTDSTDEAIDELNAAIKLLPDLAEAYYNLGLAFNKKDRITDAIWAYEEFLSCAPEHYANYVEGVQRLVEQLKKKVASAQ